MSRMPLLFVSVSIAVLLSSCGGGHSGNGGPPAHEPGRGDVTVPATVVPVTLPDGSRVPTLAPAQLRSLLDDKVRVVTGEPRCGITTYTVQYRTAGPRDSLVESAATIMVPSGTDARCSGARPVLLYAHATTLDKADTMSDLARTEPRLIAAMYAAQGYVVVAPNYQGFQGSTLDYHPYLDAQLQGADLVDALRAARGSFGAVGANASARLFVAGYSQGGYVALAAQKAMQALPGEFAITAAAGMSGPYATIRFGDTVVAGYPTRGITAFLPMVTTAGQRAGANVYGSPGEMYEAQYAPTIGNLLPSFVPVDELVAQGKLPATALFARDSLPQPQGPNEYFDDAPLVRTSYRNAYLADMAAQPCDTNAAAPLACAPRNGLRKWLVRNDLRSYVPAAPLLLCGGNDDPTVPFYNATAAQAYFAAQGAGPGFLDLDSNSIGDRWAGQRAGFEAAKLAVRTDAILHGRDPDEAVAAVYHSGLVAPFCLMAAREFFDDRVP